MYDNLITASSMLTASSIRPGTVGSALKNGTGAGSMTPSGNYTGTDDRLYIVEIDLAGEVGAATFRWRKNSSSSWEATGVVTSTTAITLEDGVQVTFAAGSGTDFDLLDRWTFKAVRFFAPERVIDLDPDAPWRSKVINADLSTSTVNVEIFDGSAGSFADKTTEALTDSDGQVTGAFWADVAGGDRVYVGSTRPFDRIAVALDTAGAGAGALTAEYYNGSSWAAVSGLSDGTASGGDTFAQDGDITWTIPTDWALQGDASLDADKYYVRLQPANDPTTDPDADLLRPDAVPETLTIDLDSSAQVRAAVMHGHNISASATVIQLLANTSDEWGSPAFAQDLGHQTDTIAVFLDQTYRYWQIRVADKSNADGYIEIGELFIGDYFEPSREYILFSSAGERALEDQRRTGERVLRPVLDNRASVWDLDYTGLTASDESSFRTMFDSIKSRTARRSKPFFWTPDSALPADTFFVHWMNDMSFEQIGGGLKALEVELEEQPLTAI